MAPEPDGQRTRKRREKLLGLGLIQKNVWVPAMFASALMAFALELRRQAGMLLPTDTPEDDASGDNGTSKLMDGQTPIIKQAVAQLARGEKPSERRPRAKR